MILTLTTTAFASIHRHATRHLIANSLCGGRDGDSPGLRDADDSPDPKASLVQELRHLGTLTRAGLSAENNGVVLSVGYSFDDLNIMLV